MNIINDVLWLNNIINTPRDLQKSLILFFSLFINVKIELVIDNNNNIYNGALENIIYVIEKVLNIEM